MTTTRYESCACGLPLHYASPASEHAVREIIEQLGETVVVQVATGGSYRVPRHYIALHGLAAIDLPALAIRYGWEPA